MKTKKIKIIKKMNINNINKEKILLSMDILLYNYEEILSINCINLKENEYKKIIFIYDIINIMLKRLYYFYKDESFSMLNNWYKNKKRLNIDILDECINNFMKKNKLMFF